MVSPILDVASSTIASSKKQSVSLKCHVPHHNQDKNFPVQLKKKKGKDI